MKANIEFQPTTQDAQIILDAMNRLHCKQETIAKTLLECTIEKMSDMERELKHPAKPAFRHDQQARYEKMRNEAIDLVMVALANIRQYSAVWKNAYTEHKLEEWFRLDSKHPQHGKQVAPSSTVRTFNGIMNRASTLVAQGAQPFAQEYTHSLRECAANVFMAERIAQEALLTIANIFGQTSREYMDWQNKLIRALDRMPQLTSVVNQHQNELRLQIGAVVDRQERALQALRKGVGSCWIGLIEKMRSVEGEMKYVINETTWIHPMSRGLQVRLELHYESVSNLKEALSQNFAATDEIQDVGAEADYLALKIWNSGGIRISDPKVGIQLAGAVINYGPKRINLGDDKLVVASHLHVALMVEEIPASEPAANPCSLGQLGNPPNSFPTVIRREPKTSEPDETQKTVTDSGEPTQSKENN